MPHLKSYRLFFVTGAPPKISKYKKVNLGFQRSEVSENVYLSAGNSPLKCLNTKVISQEVLATFVCFWKLYFFYFKVYFLDLAGCI